nr:odorant receptor 13a-like [Nomia melanderi]
MSVVKIFIMLVHKKKFFKLVVHLQRRFLSLEIDYDPYEKSIMQACRRSCAICIILFTLFTHLTVFCYLAVPLIVNIGKNESDRILPFTLWINAPISLTPYYEIAFFIEVLAVYQVGVCYFCFDNFLFMMNIHTTTQFRILRHRLTNMANTSEEEHDQKERISSSTEKCYVAFKGYIQQHQALIAYCQKLEEVFNSVVLGQMLIFSLLICLDGCQVLMADVNSEKRFIFVFHLVSCVGQLLMFTYSCDGLIHESVNVGAGAYGTPWPSLTMDKYGTTMRKDLLFVLARSKVLSTAMSYFTLLKRTMEDTADDM